MTIFQVENIVQNISRYLSLQDIINAAICSKDHYNVFMDALANDITFVKQIIAICATWLENGRLNLQSCSNYNCFYLQSNIDQSKQQWLEFKVFLSKFIRNESFNGKMVVT